MSIGWSIYLYWNGESTVHLFLSLLLIHLENTKQHNSNLYLQDLIKK